jgi:cytoskeleton protein RodZ
MQNDLEQHPQNELNMAPMQAPVPMPAEAPVTNAGLTRAREAKRLSIGDVAYALKVSPRVIESIEVSDWAALPGRTFTVGILRAYGRMLEVSVDAIIAEIPGAMPDMKKNLVQANNARKAAPTSRRDGESKRQEKRMLKAGAVMITLAIVLAYAIPTRVWENLLQSGQALAERWVRPDVVQPPVEPVAVAPAGAGAPAGSDGAPAAQTQAQTSPGTLELKFSAPAWVEVRDYTGRIIYSQLNTAGTTQFITGAAPLDVLIGNARQVQARWRDEPVKLDKLSTDDVARQVLR